MSDRLLLKCPECGKRKLRRLFRDRAGIIFKGSGSTRPTTGKERDEGGRKAEADAKGILPKTRISN